MFISDAAVSPQGVEYVASTEHKAEQPGSKFFGSIAECVFVAIRAVSDAKVLAYLDGVPLSVQDAAFNVFGEMDSSLWHGFPERTAGKDESEEPDFDSETIHSATASVLLRPQHGYLLEDVDGGRDWSYVPEPGYKGGDYAEFVVKIGGYLVRVANFLKVESATPSDFIAKSKSCPRDQWLMTPGYSSSGVKKGGGRPMLRT